MSCCSGSGCSSEAWLSCSHAISHIRVTRTEAEWPVNSTREAVAGMCYWVGTCVISYRFSYSLVSLSAGAQRKLTGVTEGAMGYMGCMSGIYVKYHFSARSSPATTTENVTQGGNVSKTLVVMKELWMRSSLNITITKKTHYGLRPVLVTKPNADHLAHQMVTGPSGKAFKVFAKFSKWIWVWVKGVSNHSNTMLFMLVTVKWSL